MQFKINLIKKQTEHNSVYEGTPIVIMGDPMTNADLTQEYFYGEKYGMAIVLAGGNSGIGRYEIA